MNRREEAKHLLVHYFRTAFEAAGLTWNGDNTAEVGSALDLLIEEAASRGSDLSVSRHLSRSRT